MKSLRGNKMERLIKKYRNLVMYSIDIGLLLCSYIIAYFVLFDLLYVVEVGNPQVLRTLFFLFPLIIITQIILLNVLHVYPAIWRHVSLVDVGRIGISIAGVGAIVLAVDMVSTTFAMPFSLVFVASGIQFLAMVGVRVLYRSYTRNKTMQEQSEYPRSNVVIIGAGLGGDSMYRELTTNPIHHVNIIGYLDDNKNKNNWLLHGKRVLGSVHDLEKISEKYNIEGAYLAIPSLENKRVSEILQSCLDQGIKVKRLVYSEEKKDTSLQDVNIEDLLGRNKIQLDQKEIGSYIENKVVLVSGAGGSIGSELCRQIIAYHPKEVIMVDIYENNLYDLQQELKHIGVKQQYLIASVRDEKTIEKIFKINNIDLVYHAAAHKHVPLMEDMPKEAIKNNIFGTYNVVNMACKYQAERFTLVSTDKAVNPTNVMGASKRMAELVIQSFAGGHTKIGAVRFGNVLGSNGSVIPLFKKQIAKGGPITITDPEINRYFMLIPEAVSLVLQAGGYASNGEIFVLDMGKPVKIVDLAKNLLHLSGLKEGKDIDIIFTGLRPGEKLYEELILDKEVNEKTENDLIYVAHPISLEKEEIQKRLDILHELVHTNISNKEIKEKLMELIL